MAQGVASSRDDFLRAEAALANAKPRQARQLIKKLQNYPLLGYLELELAQHELPTASHEAIARVMNLHGDLPTAYVLRRAWFEKLARDEHWELLLAHRVANDDSESECLVAHANWKLGHVEQAWSDVQQIWLTGQSLPDQCDPVLGAWRKAGRLTDQLLWERVKLAMAARKYKLARYLRRYASAERASLIDRWLALNQQPAQLPRFVSDAKWAGEDLEHVVVEVFSRAAKRDAQTALTLFSRLPKERLSESTTGQLRDQVSRALASRSDPKAAQWLKHSTTAATLRAQAVNALSTHRHDLILQAVELMDSTQGDRERWRFWRAHSMAALGRNDEAQQAFRSLAKERSYYGFLAADRVAQPYVLGHRPLLRDPLRQKSLAENARVRRTREWLALNRDVDARREWHALLGQLDSQGQRDAAVLARSWQWFEGGIRAAARAMAWDDLDVRFPLAYRSEVAGAASRSALPASRVLSIVRQESAFMRNIRSSAGALGLMQLMPATARQVARRAGQRKPNRAAILEPSNNLLLGSLYLARLQQRYGNHPVLATAAYNAGPGRVRQWRRIPKAMESRDWIEAIPFTETRRYVRRVLTYQIIYAERLGEKSLRLRDLMPKVKPISY
jgi:soluble lytic murein transglycosylase